MFSDRLRLVGKALIALIPLAAKLLLQKIASIYHRYTYQAVPNAKNVIVIGGSFAGFELTKRLIATVRTGYKVILIEKNSHFHHVFNFPRFSVFQGHEHTAFIPYDGIAKGAPEGIFQRVQNRVVGISDTHVVLASGEEIEYAFLAIATGSSQGLPTNVESTEREQGCAELRSVQEAIKSAERIAVVGAGAVGVELATDIKAFYPEKNVTLVHSRGQLLNRFGKRLHEYVLPVLQELKIKVVLNERPRLPVGKTLARDTTLRFSDEREETFDLVIACIGQTPNSGILASLSPSAISKATSRILVKPTLQISTGDDRHSNIFAVGDVAEHGGPMMARAGFFQADIVTENILALIQGRRPSKTYTPQSFFEGAIKLTLGKSHYAVFAMENAKSDVLVVGHNGKLDLDIGTAWRRQGVSLKDAKREDEDQRRDK